MLKLLSLLKRIPNAVWLLALAIGLLLVCVKYANWKTDRIDAELDRAKREIAEANMKLETAGEIIQQMHDEHEIALESANNALRERIEIYEAARERICKAEKAIGGNTDFCNQLLPDDLRMLWQGSEAGINTAPDSVRSAD